MEERVGLGFGLNLLLLLAMVATNLLSFYHLLSISPTSPTTPSDPSPPLLSPTTSSANSPPSCRATPTPVPTSTRSTARLPSPSDPQD
ncbi:hypothetical protein QJS10_CPB14g01178 [Acorus calamus]|uniref:Uncharacterized protein n=1 Tax=Acorus calamus TaxID=4465 RepID=A0AAV9DDQ1_ACOCL|nr:hypothetical protein QJS10_CPB14g01178 [Acorus calamus]